MRISWPEYFMGIAEAAARRANCDRASVGAVLVQNQRVISTGYNGAPPGLPTCEADGHRLAIVDGRQSCTRTIHAEMNALLSAGRDGQALAGSVLYVTHEPCLRCAMHLIAAGVRHVVYRQGYGDGMGVLELKAAGVTVHGLRSGN